MNSKQAIAIFVALTLTLSSVLAEEVPLPVSTGENTFQVKFEKKPAGQSVKLTRTARQFYPGGGYYNPYGGGYGFGGGFGGAQASAQASASSSSNGFGGGFYGK